MLQRVHDALGYTSRIAVWISGAAMMACAIYITGDVICRKFLNISIGGSDEITAYVFSASTTWSFAYCLLHRANIRIDALYNYLPRILKCTIDVISVILLIGFAGIVAERAVDTLSASISNNSTSITPLGTPMWIPQSFWVVGWLFFALTLVFVLTHATIAFAKGDLARVNQIAGLRTIDEEISEETQGTGVSLRGNAGDDAC